MGGTLLEEVLQRSRTTHVEPIQLLGMSAILASQARQLRHDRILRGQAAARAMSAKFGRPPIAKVKLGKADSFLRAGKGVRQMPRLAGI